MILRRNRGFTLIELLVVIAIIAILAAMLFPVFARARESARKIQCLSNVKNIAMALQMYLTDYDRFPPSEHRAEVTDWYNNHDSVSCSCYSWQANPYLRWPVILDEYIKNRDVWRCPSARRSQTFAVNPCVPDWFTAMQNGHNDACSYNAADGLAFPPGWGGTITDSYQQIEVCAGADTGGIELGIGCTTWTSMDMKTGEIKDPSKKVVVADCGVQMDLARTSWVAYPDFCRLDGAACSVTPNPLGTSATCLTHPGADWTNCSWSRDCGAGTTKFGTDVQTRKDHAYPRHLGGSNLGFADGHAAWMPSEAILYGGDEAHAAGRTNAPLEGLQMCGTFLPPL